MGSIPCGARALVLAGVLLLGASPVVLANCLSQIEASAPSERFEFSEDQSVALDRQTGLQWQRCAVGMRWEAGMCQGEALSFTWPRALALGYGAWRLPNIKELSSLVEQRCVSPAINTEVFPATPNGAGFWSASPAAADPSLAWRVLFSVGSQSPYWQGGLQRVRLVKTPEAATG